MALTRFPRFARMASKVASRSFATEGAPLIRTALYDLHVETGGQMVPFAGYELPVQYETGIKVEHLHTREVDKAGLFDVSHMGQIRWYGKDREEFLESVVVGDIQSLQEGASVLSLITNAHGGIIDDTVISNAGDHIYMVVNGACKEKDMAHFDEQLVSFKAKGKDVSYEYVGDDAVLVALQGDAAASVLAKHLDDTSIDLAKVSFMEGMYTSVGGVAGCRVTRCGYTGEDGFEIGIAGTAAEANSIVQALMEDSSVAPVGLGARDSLRLEAGLCLYGNDLDDNTTPIEGGLTWTIPKRRRVEGGFLGSEFILPQIGGKVDKVRVGLADMKAPARGKISAHGSEEEIGHVTSSGFGPTLGKPVAMGYVAKAHAKKGTVVDLMVRGKPRTAVVTKMPFVKANYYRGA